MTKVCQNPKSSLLGLMSKSWARLCPYLKLQKDLQQNCLIAEKELYKR
ncbi:hypothetical protein FDUTEX481_01797 [Tolypothrix sp. PCC 7601]|nr:hypothetical protein FDUTEX481_01797 [Tolypothrix sp. PCC 7601]